MVYVERNNGNIAGVYSNLQPGYAEEYLEDTNPEVVNFLNPPKDIVKEFQTAIENYVDVVAQSKGYSNSLSIAGYSNSTVPQWKEEAETFITWRDQVWLYAFTELEKVQNGQRETPTIEEFIAELPVIEWPE